MESIIETILVGGCGGTLAWMLLRAMEPGMLLAFWSSVLERLNRPKAPTWQRLLSKPLGGCAFCFGFWVAMFAGGFWGLSLLELLFSAAVALVALEHLDQAY